MRRVTPVDEQLFHLLRHGDPWTVLVIAALLKVTRKEAVILHLPQILRTIATPQAALRLPIQRFRRLLHPLGLWRRRVIELRRIAHHLAANGPPQSREEVTKLYGAGDYLADCYALFVLRDFSQKPRDYALRAYWRHNDDRCKDRLRRSRLRPRQTGRTPG